MKTLRLSPILALFVLASACATDSGQSGTDAMDVVEGDDDTPSPGQNEDDVDEPSSDEPSPTDAGEPGGGSPNAGRGGASEGEPDDAPSAGAGPSSGRGGEGSGASGQDSGGASTTAGGSTSSGGDASVGGSGGSTPGAGASSGEAGQGGTAQGGTAQGGTAQGGTAQGGDTATEEGCPTAPPPEGSGCTEPWTPSDPFAFSVRHCTWGDDPRPECRTAATCTEGTWAVTAPNTDVCDVPRLPDECPSAPPEVGSACANSALDCWYEPNTSPPAEPATANHCFCSDCFGGSSYPVCQQIDPPEWACDDVTPGCPETLPQAGSSCDEEGLSCGPSCELVITCSDSVWQWYAGNCPICASPETRISTPSGERAIAELRAGELVYSVDHGELVAVPLLRVASTPVVHHHVMRVTLDNGRVLSISPGHPTWDGRLFAALVGGSLLDERFRVTDAQLVPYEYDRTYDILPDSDTGTYLAEGALIGSTLFNGSAFPR